MLGWKMKRKAIYSYQIEHEIKAAMCILPQSAKALGERTSVLIFPLHHLKKTWTVIFFIWLYLVFYYWNQAVSSL